VPRRSLLPPAAAAHLHDSVNLLSHHLQRLPTLACCLHDHVGQQVQHQRLVPVGHSTTRLKGSCISHICSKQEHTSVQRSQHRVLIGVPAGTWCGCQAQGIQPSGNQQICVYTPAKGPVACAASCLSHRYSQRLKVWWWLPNTTPVRTAAATVQHKSCVRLIDVPSMPASHQQQDMPCHSATGTRHIRARAHLSPQSGWHSG
jgi:hypothetical protein